MRKTNNDLSALINQTQRQPNLSSPGFQSNLDSMVREKAQEVLEELNSKIEQQKTRISDVTMTNVNLGRQVTALQTRLT